MWHIGPALAKKASGPPPVLEGSRVAEYAVIPKSVKYSGEGDIGPVARLAIGEAVAEGEIPLFHCDAKWQVVGTSSHPSVRQAKQRAEREYPGISKAWVETGLPRGECSFCGRTPDQVKRMIEKQNVRICDICVRDAAEKLTAN